MPKNKKSDSKLVYRLMDAAKGILDISAYKMEDVRMHQDGLSADQIERLESAKIDLAEAYDKLESILKQLI